MNHTDQQINIALAKAIGYRDEDIRVQMYNGEPDVQVCRNEYWCRFSFRATSVIWPIAAKYDVFPIMCGEVWRAPYTSGFYATPELAVAMAVIEMKGVTI